MALDPREIYYGIAGQRYGPVAVEVVRGMIAAGRLGPEDHLWDPDHDDWIQAKRYPALLKPPPLGSEEDELPLEAVPEGDPWIQGRAEPIPAGFTQRFAAYVVDCLLLVPLMMIWVGQGESWFGIDLQTILGADSTLSPEQSSLWTRYMYVTEAVFFLIEGIYHAVMESSPWQATLGKRLLGLTVTDERGQRVSFRRAALRHFGRILCKLTLQLGYLMMLFSERGQGLHDRIARTLVLRR